ncbi:MAG: FkbM family methyltransferase [Maritimibacter sp.]|nr:FkbM family methyltransferase [Maritimibacter sp.]
MNQGGTGRKLLRKLKRRLKPHLHRPDLRLAHTVLGSSYGGWPVVANSLSKDSLVYSFGVGEDISFDRALIEAFGCRIKAFDPTPRCIDWVARQDLPEGMTFVPLGLSDRTETLVFTAPERDDHVSYSVSGQTGGGERVELPVRSLAEILESEGDREIDLLKMDIEGSEYVAVPRLLEDGIRPRQLCVEFHHGIYDYTPDQTRAAVDGLRAAGYGLYHVSDTGREYGFVLRSTL